MTQIYFVDDESHDKLRSESYAGLTGKEGGWQGLVVRIRDSHVGVLPVAFRPGLIKDYRLQAIDECVAQLDNLRSVVEAGDE